MSASDVRLQPDSLAGSATATRWSRLSDWLNPILVREVKQAVKGRVFPVTVMLALAISVMIATVVASEYRDGETGRGAFDAGFATLIPLVLFIIPMQAYQSMRTELKGGIVEQLLLTRLSPNAVLAGKLQAAMVQFMLYVSVMSPLIATSYLLRGVDLPTIAISLAFALVICLAATAFAVSSAAQAILPSMQTMASLGIAFGLGFGTVTMVGFVASSAYSRSIGMLLRSGDFAQVSSAFVGVALLATVLSWLAARTFLMHAFENKSTGFRLFLFSLPVCLLGWMLLFVEPGRFQYVFPMMCLVSLVVGIIFGVFMVTEQARMSPRVTAHVATTGLRAALSTPLLPGRDRGMLCFVCYTAMIVGTMLIGWSFVLPSSASAALTRTVDEVLWSALMMITYALVYLAIGRWIRDRLSDTVAANRGARIFVPLILFLLCLLPLLADVVFVGYAQSWHLGHIMNPFWTIAEFYDSHDEILAVCVPVLVIVCVLHVPVFMRGWKEVREASAARRRRMSTPQEVAEVSTRNEPE